MEDSSYLNRGGLSLDQFPEILGVPGKAGYWQMCICGHEIVAGSLREIS